MARKSLKGMGADIFAPSGETETEEPKAAEEKADTPAKQQESTPAAHHNDAPLQHSAGVEVHQHNSKTAHHEDSPPAQGVEHQHDSAPLQHQAATPLGSGTIPPEHQHNVTPAHHRDHTLVQPDVAGTMAGGPHASTPAQQQKYPKATFYLPATTIDRLEKLWLAKRATTPKLKKSDIVRDALEQFLRREERALKP